LKLWISGLRRLDRKKIERNYLSRGYGGASREDRHDIALTLANGTVRACHLKFAKPHSVNSMVDLIGKI
jgi:hypothetical protein